MRRESDDDLDLKEVKAVPEAEIDKSTLIEEDFSSIVCKKLDRLLREPALCDVTFVVGPGKEEIHSVKAHLACQSEYFRAMFFGKLQESTEPHPRVVLVDFSMRPFRVFLDFIHTGTLRFSSKEEGLISELLKLADHFDVPHLFTACYQITAKKIDENNVLELLLVSERYNDKQLFEHALAYIMKNGEKLFANPTFVRQLTKSMLLDFLTKDELAVTEITLFQAVLDWGRHKISIGEYNEELSVVVSDCMKLIRFALIPAKKLMDVVRPSGFIDKKVLMSILAYQADRKNFDAAKLGLNIERRFRVLHKSGAVPASIVTRTTTFVAGHTAGYNNTHDGGLAVCNGKLVAHYGNDGVGGNRAWIIDIGTGERTSINLPFPTHGSYPASDFNKYVYVFEDSDSAHGNGFARIDTETNEVEILAAVPGAHCRYTSGCIQNGCFWKLASGNVLHKYSIDEGVWESLGWSSSSQAILMADPNDEDFIWFMVQGGALKRYCISSNSAADLAPRPSGFSLGANYSAVIIPRIDDETGDVGGVMISAYQSGSGWQVYDSVRNSWSGIAWPDIQEGGHVAYEFPNKTVWLQCNNQSTIQKLTYEG
jgi:hypothetical protein